MALFSIKQYEVKSSDTNANNEMKPYALLHALEDAAYTNAESLGWGYSKTSTLNYGWFLIKYHLRFESFPKSLDVISIKTWAVRSKGVYCRREFEVYDANNNKIGVASTLWVLVDLETKKILNPYKELDFPELKTEHAIETTFPKIESLSSIDISKEIEITYDDIDLNRHVNNSNYLKFAINTLSYDFLLSNTIKEIEIYYKKEAKYGDVILSEAQFKEDIKETLHSIKNKETGEELASIKVLWKEK